jgi:hypothetical protein
MTFLREVKSFSLIENALHGYNHTERTVNNTIVQKAYRKIKTPPSDNKSKTSKAQSTKAHSSRRDLVPPLENSKFNLGPLIKQEGELKLSPLYEPLAELLRLLYRKKLFEKEKNSEKLEYRLIEAMLKKARKLPEVDHVADLYPEDLALRGIFYKMLKGTNQYSRDAGIPPLGYYLWAGKKDKAVALSFASPVLLEALFGMEISSEILNLERQKSDALNERYSLSKEDLQSILMKNPTKASLLTTLDSYLNYSKQPILRKQVAKRDKKTGILVEKEISQ